MESSLGIEEYVEMLPEKGQQVINKELVRLRALAIEDPLTKVFNRRGLTEKIEEMVEVAKEGKLKQVVVLMGDVDNFKVLNDVLGHPFGDAFLQITAEKLKKGDIVGRFGGDEFLVVLPVFQDSEGFSEESLKEKIRLIQMEVEKGIGELSKKLIREGDHWPISNGKVAGKISFGGMIFTSEEFLKRTADGGDIITGLVRESDKKLYEAKKRYF